MATRRVRGACPHDCPDRCSWIVTVDDTGTAVALNGNPDHPLTAGRLCTKVNGYLHDRVYSPHRITRPLRRTGPKGSGEFAPIGLDEALDEIATRLTGIAAADGPAAIIPFSYEGTQGLLQSKSMSERFFARLGAAEVGHTICGPTGGAGLSAVNGFTVGVLPEDAVHANLIIVWGANPLVTNQHLWAAMLSARSRGARIVVIDPVATRTAHAADRHLMPRPGTDAALALGIAHLLITDDLVDHEFIAAHTTGFDELATAAADFTPDRTADITGIAESDIRTLAADYAAARPALIRLMVGMEHHTNGAALYAAIAALPALTGMWRHHGGGIAYHTSPLFNRSLNLDGLRMAHLAPGPRRRINMVQLGQALTDPHSDPPARALIVHGSNPAVIVPRQPLVRQGLARDDLFTVVHEHVLTDTARYADIVLPATTQLEHLDLMKSWGHTDLMLNLPAIAPPGDAISVTDLFRDLATRMGFTEPCFTDTDDDLLATALNSAHPYLHGITLDHLRENGWQRLNLRTPHTPYAAGFPTPDNRARLHTAARAAATALPPPADPRWPLQLLSVKGLRSMNSTYADTTQCARDGGPWLDLHPDDAAARAINDGDPIEVHNQHATITLHARVSTRVRPGVVAIMFGTWSGTRAGDRGAAANLLTPDTLTDGGGSAFHDTYVDVRRCELSMQV
ncbi:molybdopterin-containing oxidoreductase family protein [Plantactinospora endophytica]|uniref:Molybdopterin oxidoreductase n=1 Tax=Plantactinospora endophytica TaxID=673535 RepID=A0ABQ4E7K0_9ACTN|nr:molybdopterin-dependent oxidoreductase [Plantactinospora endophytica]GIG90687.1 molybdopterin oxidoreductase [Plantactinospora endophytica]